MPDRIVSLSGENFCTTHGAKECIEASQLFGEILLHALSGANKSEILVEHMLEKLISPYTQTIAKRKYQSQTVINIRGSGYVVKALEAALWCFWTSEAFEQAVLKATNLGDDADTTAALCGQLADTFYSVQGIPSHWLERLTMKEEISTLADQLYAAT